MALKHNLLGKRFGKLLVTERVEKHGKSPVTYWKCKCDCGKETITQVGQLMGGWVTQCIECARISRKGKKQVHPRVEPGMRFGKVTVIKQVAQTTKSTTTRWECKCDCGGTTYVSSHHLWDGMVTRCKGCADIDRSIKMTGKNHHSWMGGRSFGKYCPRFNAKLKEEIREKYDRKCYICGAPEGKRKHSVHHIDYNKVQGCKGMRWSLVPLCASCHSKTNSNRHFWFNFLYPTHVLEGLDNWGKLGDDIIG